MTIKASFDNGVASVSYTIEGRKKIRTIPSESFCKAILSSSNVGSECTIMPVGLRIKAKAGDHVIVGYEFPERVILTKFRDNGRNFEFNTVQPWGMTFIEFTDTPEGLQWSRFYQFALKGPITNGDTQMYRWPGSNVYDDYHCCIGDIKVPKIPSIEQTGGLPFIFYNGINNRDLSGGRFKTFKDAKGVDIDVPFKLYKSLEVVDGVVKPFPYDILYDAVRVKSFLSNGGYM